LGNSDIPAEAARLVQQQNLHLAFGDFDDHLEDVTIGTVFCLHLSDFWPLVDCDLDWLRNRACLPP
jgi:hypothetical protein